MTKENEKETPVLETPKPELTEPKLDKEVVEVPKTTLEKLMKQLDDQSSSIKRLEYAASKAGLSRYDAKNAGEIGKSAKVSIYEDKIVVAWQIIEDIVEKNPVNNAWMEKQTIRLWYHGIEKHEDVPYQQYSRRVVKKKVTVNKETSSTDGSVVWEVSTQDDEPVTFEISATFLN